MLVLDERLLKIGDIILCRFDDDLSQKVIDNTNSNYSHAMLYVRKFSIIESGFHGVSSDNIQRKSFANQSDVIVLRLKDNTHLNKIPTIISFVRGRIGTAYCLREAYRVKDIPTDRALRNNRQFCSRLVAQCFDKAGIPLVNNSDYCSPKDLEESDYLQIFPNVLKTPNKKEIEILSSNSIPNEQLLITEGLLKEARVISGEDLQTFPQIIEHLLLNPSLDGKFTKSLQESGYLDLGKKTFVEDPWIFNKESFNYCFNSKKERIYHAELLIEIGKELSEQFMTLYSDIFVNYQKSKLTYFLMLSSHYLVLNQFFQASVIIGEEVLSEYKINQN